MIAGFFALLFLIFAATAEAQPSIKLDAPLKYRATLLTGSSPIIVRPLNTSVDLLLQTVGGRLGRALPSINARVADVPNTALLTVAGNALVQKVALDRKTAASNERTGATVGATAVRAAHGLDGAGIGVAIIDSGIVNWHDDLTNPSVSGSQRVTQFVDFVGGGTQTYDDYGHGTHVAGIIAGNGYDSDGRRTGIAPGATLVVLKALEASGTGRISNIIAAIDYAVRNKAQFNIRVINLSVAAGVYESYTTDFLAEATRQAVEQGIVVVAAAGNFGRTPSGQTWYGGITAPGNAPWVLTVGASSHMGTIDRGDDVVAAFSSRGPTRYDGAVKPDLVAPGVGIESLSAAGSTLASRYAAYLLNGTVATSFPPYLSLSGTSMAAPVVAGTVALMLQANPSLTPHAVKAILQYTAQLYAGYDVLTQGAGFLNAAGAVQLAEYFAQPSGTYPFDSMWSQQILWGNRFVHSDSLLPDSDPAVWAANGDETVVWGTNGDETVVWGTNGDETVVWGTNGDETVVWGTNGDETVVWGTSCGSDCQPVIWDP